MVANGGTADKTTLREIASQTTSPRLARDAQHAVPDVGNSDVWWIDASLMAYDCRGTGVQIPTGP